MGLLRRKSVKEGLSNSFQRLATGWREITRQLKVVRQRVADGNAGSTPVRRFHSARPGWLTNACHAARYHRRRAGPVLRRPCSMAELVPITRRRRHDGGDLLDRPPVRRSPCGNSRQNSFHRVDRIEIDRQRVGADPSARIQAAGPAWSDRSVRDLRAVPDGFEGRPRFPRSTHDCAFCDDATGLRTSPEGSCGLQCPERTRAIPAPSGRLGARRFLLPERRLRDSTKP